MRRLKRFDKVDLAHTFEGIRFSLLSVQRAFVRIETFCRDREAQGPDVLTFLDCFDLLCDCWQVIDGADRARFLVESVPNWQREKAGRRIFAKRMEKVREFRNLFHHLGSKAATMPEKSSSVMGSLSWQGAENPNHSLTVMIDTGALESSYPSSTYDRMEKKFVSDFVFCVANSRISLSEITSERRKFGALLDKILQEADAFADGEASALIFAANFQSAIESDQKGMEERPSS